MAAVNVEGRLFRTAFAHTWRDNMRAALLSDAIQAPGSSSSFWLLYIPSLIRKRFEPVAPSVICDLCKKCVAALTKRNKKGEPALKNLSMDVFVDFGMGLSLKK